jgi:hypothetical protein
MNPTPEIRVRTATADDADDIARLLGELGYPADPREVPSRLSAMRNQGGTVVLAIDSTGAALGMMALARLFTLHSSAPVAYITARLTLTSAEHRSDAHAFYPSCGLPYTGRRFATSISELESP